jgi:hypothetical protein
MKLINTKCKWNNEKVLNIVIICLSFLTYGLNKYNNVNLVFNITKMANIFHKMVWKARKDGPMLD